MVIARAIPIARPGRNHRYHRQPEGPYFDRRADDLKLRHDSRSQRHTRLSQHENRQSQSQNTHLPIVVWTSGFIEQFWWFLGDRLQVR